MLLNRAQLQAGQKVLIWGAAGGLGVFATQLCARGRRASASASSPRDEKGELVEQLGALGYINRNEFEGMMRTGGETPEEEKERFKVVARLRQARQGDPRRRRPTSSSSTSARRRSRPRSSPSRRSARSSSAAPRRATPRLRRPLPVDAPEGDHRLALRQRLGVQPGQPADRGGQDPARCCGRRCPSRRSPTPTSSCTRTSTSARSRSSSAPTRGGRGPDGRGPRRDPRGGGRLMAGVVHIPWYATGFRGDKLEAALAEIAPIALRYGATQLHRLPLPRRPLQVPADRRRSRARSTGSATGRARSSPTSA